MQKKSSKINILYCIIGCLVGFFLLFSYFSYTFFRTINFSALDFKFDQITLSIEDSMNSSKDLIFENSFLTTTSDDGQIVFEIDPNKSIDFIVLNVSEIENVSLSQFFYSNDLMFSEENSVSVNLNLGENIIPIKSPFSYLRFDPSNTDNASLKIDSFELASKIIAHPYFYISLFIGTLLWSVFLFIYCFFHEKLKTSKFYAFLKNPKGMLFFLLTISCLFVYFQFLVGIRPFMYNDIGSDTQNLYFPIYNMIVNALKDNNFSLWNLSYGTGTNIINMQSTILDPFAIIAYIMGLIFGNSSIIYALIIMQIVKIYFCGFLMYSYLSLFNFSSSAKVITSVLTAFNGFFMLWGQHYFFNTACIYIILVLLILEKSFKDKKYLIHLSLVTFLVCIYSFYFAYMILFFAAVYFIIRSAQRFTYKNFTDFFKCAIPTAGFVLAGVLMSVIVLYPAILLLAMSNRIDISQQILAFWSPNMYWQTFTRMLSNNLSGVGGGYVGFSNYYEVPNLFFSSFFFIILSQYLYYTFKFSVSKKDKIIKAFVVFLLLFLLLIPFGSSIFNGFVSPFSRYTYLLMPIFALMVAYTIDFFRKNNIIHYPLLVISTIISSSLIMLSNQSTKIILNYSIFLVALCILFSSSVILLQNKDLKLSSKRAVSILICCLFILNTVVDGYLTSNYRITSFDTSPNLKETGFSQNTNRSLEYLRENDDSTYRIEKNYRDVSLANDSMAQNYMGISVYNSMINYDITKFYYHVAPKIAYSNSIKAFSLDPENVEIASLLGIKYLIFDREIDLPKKYFEIAKFADRTIYQNKQFEGFTRGYNETISESIFLEMPHEKKEKQIIDILVLEDEHISDENYTHQNAEIVSEDITINRDDFLKITVNNNNSKYLFIPISYQDGWTAKVNSKEVPVLKANLCFMAIEIENGVNDITLEYNTAGVKEGAILSIFGLCLFVLFSFLVLKSPKKENHKHKTNKIQKN